MVDSYARTQTTQSTHYYERNFETANNKHLLPFIQVLLFPPVFALFPKVLFLSRPLRFSSLLLLLALFRCSLLRSFEMLVCSRVFSGARVCVHSATNKVMFLLAFVPFKVQTIHMNFLSILLVHCTFFALSNSLSLSFTSFILRVYVSELCFFISFFDEHRRRRIFYHCCFHCQTFAFWSHLTLILLVVLYCSVRSVSIFLLFIAQPISSACCCSTVEHFHYMLNLCSAKRMRNHPVCVVV